MKDTYLLWITSEHLYTTIWYYLTVTRTIPAKNHQNALTWRSKPLPISHPRIISIRLNQRQSVYPSSGVHLAFGQISRLSSPTSLSCHVHSKYGQSAQYMEDCSNFLRSDLQLQGNFSNETENSDPHRLLPLTASEGHLISPISWRILCDVVLPIALWCPPKTLNMTRLDREG